MHNLFLKDAFQGASQKKAYFVKFDGKVRIQKDIDPASVII
jgi:hypothetical protein